jgi:hypothetical protein
VPYGGDGPYPKAICRQPALAVRALLLNAGPGAARRVTWRDGSRRRAGRPVAMSSKFVFQRARPASPAIRSAYLPNSASSTMGMDLTVDGVILTGTWVEDTDKTGYYRGKRYVGGIQMVADPSGARLAGNGSDTARTGK